ncbi:MAG: hypothetical protein ACHWZW_14340 [Spirulina sp.]
MRWAKAAGLGLLGAYLLGYVYARVFVFHAVERYSGADGKGGPRQDYITKRERPAGEGWEYQLFLPTIKAEEEITNYLYNR